MGQEGQDVVTPSEEVSAVILAGGRSARMGQDKAWLDIQGQPMAEHIARRILPLAAELIFVAQDAEPFRRLASALPVPARVTADRFPGAGPLAGIHAGLSEARLDLVLVLAVDMPFVRVPLLRYMISLAAGYDAVVPALPHVAPPQRGTAAGAHRTEEHEAASTTPSERLALEPLHALYRLRCLPAVTARLEAGDRRAISFLPDVRARLVLPHEIAPFDPDFSSFRNVNTPEEWRLAAARLAGQDPPPS